MEVGGDNEAVMYQHHQYTPEPFSPERANILEQTTQSIDTSNISETVHRSLQPHRSLNDEDEEMTGLTSVDDQLKPSEVQESEFDKDEGDTRYEVDVDEELRDDDEDQDDPKEEEYDYTGEDTIPNTNPVEEDEDKDDETLPPYIDDEDL